jgi:integrase
MGDVAWNREKPRLLIRRSVSEEGVFQEPKTKGSRRTIPLGPQLQAALREHRMASRWKGEDDLIFPNQDGGPLDRQNLVNREFRPALKKAGLPRIRFHDLRHTAATLMLKEHVPITVVSKILGHAKPAMTLDVYSHALPDHLDEAAGVLETAIFKPQKVAAEWALPVQHVAGLHRRGRSPESSTGSDQSSSLD